MLSVNFRCHRSCSFFRFMFFSPRSGPPGIVILMLDTRLEPAVAKDMIKGAPDVMHSEFHLKYAMLLNLTRMEAGDPQASADRICGFQWRCIDISEMA